MSTVSYTRYELLRTVRSFRFFFFSLIFPVVLYLLIAGSNRHGHIDHIPVPLYFLSGMVSWGAMTATMGTGARVAGERQVGWNRQLRITPLSTSAYFGAKVVCGYLMAGASIVLLYACGLALGVHLTFSGWLVMTALLLAGLVPFTILGLLIGHLLTMDAVGPALGGVTALFALLGGSWGPIATNGWLLHVVQLVPSYWLVQAGNAALGGGGWPAKGWIVIAIWSVVLFRVTARVWQRDTAKV